MDICSVLHCLSETSKWLNAARGKPYPEEGERSVASTWRVDGSQAPCAQRREPPHLARAPHRRSSSLFFSSAYLQTIACRLTFEVRRRRHAMPCRYADEKNNDE